MRFIEQIQIFWLFLIHSAFTTGALSLVDKMSEGYLGGTCTGESGACTRKRCSTIPVWSWCRGYNCHSSQQALVTSEQRGFCARYSVHSLRFLIILHNGTNTLWIFRFSFVVGYPWPAARCLPSYCHSPPPQEHSENTMKKLVHWDKTGRSLTNGCHRQKKSPPLV